MGISHLVAFILPLADEVVTKEELKGGWGGLIFMGFFFLALIAFGIWRLSRS